MQNIQCLTFTIDTCEYAIAIQHVQEILPIMWITQLADLSPELEGSIYLRSKWIPVIDLHRKLKLARECYLHTSKIMILILPQGFLLGVILDEINNIKEISQENYQINQFASQQNTLVSGIFLDKNGKSTLLLQPKNILSSELQKQLMELQHEK